MADASSGGTTLSSHYVIVKTVTKGLEGDDTATAGEERMQRGHLFADGWIDDENVLRTGILISDNIAHKFPIGTLPKPMYLRCKATGNERSGLIITEVNLGTKTPLTWGWSGTPPTGTKVGQHKSPADGNKIIEQVDCTVGGTGASCTVAVKLHSGGFSSTIATISVTDDGTHSADQLFVAFSGDDYLTADISDAVGDSIDGTLNLQVKVLCRERTGV